MPESNPCTNCGAPVPARRPSRSGHHYCKQPLCQAAKQRFFRQTQVGRQSNEVRQELVNLVHDLAHGHRSPCHVCGLEDGLPGWGHRNAEGDRPCYGLGNAGKLVGIDIIDAIHPDRVPKPRRLTPEERGIAIPHAP